MAKIDSIPRDLKDAGVSDPYHTFKKKSCMCLFIYFGLLGLRCFMGLSLVVVSRGYFLVALQRLLIAVASLDAELGL